MDATAPLPAVRPAILPPLLQLEALLQPGSGTAPEDRVAAHPVLGAGETDPRKPQRVCQKCFDLLLPMQARHDGAILRAILRAIL